MKRKWLTEDMNKNERKKQSAKKKRARMTERLQKEKSIHEKAKEEQRKFECNEFENILTTIKSGNEYCFEDFLVESRNHSYALLKDMKSPSPRMTQLS